VRVGRGLVAGLTYQSVFRTSSGCLRQ
jgi:hypothetical protein